MLMSARRFDLRESRNHFENEIEGLINAIINIAPRKELLEEMYSSVRFYDPFKKNVHCYENGRMEWKEIKGAGLAVVSLGGYFAIKNGEGADVAGDVRLNSRCTKLGEAHELAAFGKMVLPVGIYSDKASAILPMPMDKYLVNITKDESKMLPISLMKKI